MLYFCLYLIWWRYFKNKMESIILWILICLFINIVAVGIIIFCYTVYNGSKEVN